MKRVISIFLLIITLFASTHATVTFHYCGENLRHIGIVGAENHSSCCNEKRSQAADNEKNTLQNTSCCSNRFLELNTDDYSPANQDVIVKADKDFHFITDALAPVSLFDGAFTTHTLQSVFPPGAPAKWGISLLTFICIFQI